jgi:hypothetical protein
MAGASAAIGDDRRGALHHRLQSGSVMSVTNVAAAIISGRDDLTSRTAPARSSADRPPARQYLGFDSRR